MWVPVRCSCIVLPPGGTAGASRTKQASTGFQRPATQHSIVGTQPLTPPAHKGAMAATALMSRLSPGPFAGLTRPAGLQHTGAACPALPDLLEAR